MLQAKGKAKTFAKVAPATPRFKYKLLGRHQFDSHATRKGKESGCGNVFVIFAVSLKQGTLE